MKKSTLYTLIVFIVLLSMAIVVFFNKYNIVKLEKDGKWHINEKTGTLKSLRDFAIEDTASIDKIFMADKSNNTILLERKSNYWTVNGDFRARRDFTNTLLETIHRVEVLEPVPEAKLDYVLRSLSVNSIKVEIYQKGKLTKTYFVGGVDQNNTGTYMLIEGSSEPFVTHIPGFTGFLTTRFNTGIYEWRDRVIVNYSYPEIAAISIEYPDKQSFKCEKHPDNTCKLYKLPGMEAVTLFDTTAVKDFMARFKFVAFESFLNATMPTKKRDSVLSTPMLCKYTIEDIYGKTTSFKTYTRPNIKKQFDDQGELYDFDVERLYGFINNNDDMVLMQYFIVDPLTKELDDFLPTHEIQ
jgi:hypothetical protein